MQVSGLLDIIPLLTWTQATSTPPDPHVGAPGQLILQNCHKGAEQGPRFPLSVVSSQSRVTVLPWSQPIPKVLRTPSLILN